MITKEKLGGRVKEICGNKTVSLTRMIQYAQISIHFLVAAVLAGGVIFGVASPFGVAMVGASGAGICGGAALIGATFGYLVSHTFSQGLRYVSSSILTFALWFCFYDVKVFRKPWVIAVLTGVINGGTSFVYLSHEGWTPSEVLFFLAEIIVTVIATWGCVLTLLPLRMEESMKLTKLPPKIAGTVFGCCVLVSVSEVMLFEDVSLGRVVGVVLLLCFAWQQGSGVGAILGVSAGLSLDLAQLDLPVYGMAWGFSAMCAGVFQGKSRFHAGLAFLLSHGTTVLWSLEEATSFGILYEVFIGTAIFFFLPDSWVALCRLPVAKVTEEIPVGREGLEVAKVRRQLEESASVFRMLGETLRTAFRAPENENDVAVIFERTAAKVCGKCSQWSVCWERDYVSTCNVMNDVTGRMMERGTALSEDFPSYFAHRCLSFPKYLEEVNLQLTGLLYRRQYHHRVRESRVAVCGQYGQLANLLQSASVQMSQELVPQVEKSERLGEYLHYLGMDVNVTLRENPQGLLEGEIVGSGVEKLERPSVVEELSQLMGVPMKLFREGGTLYIKQLEPYMALAGFASSKKEGEKVSGDKSTYFKREDGKMFVLVCDGMGSGEVARGESTLATELLEQFLKAGVETLQALTILSSALALRGEDQGGFTTVDLLEVDLISAKATLYKYGAAPTYFRRKGEIRRMTGQSLPAGAEFGEESLPDRIQIELEAEDCLMLVSDGVSGATEEDTWLCRLLSEFEGDGVKEFARSVILKTPEGGRDDRTVVAVKIGYRGV